MIGTTISHYKILEKLGEGGMGVVYKAEDTKLKREVALKFLPSQTIASEDDKQRFIQEAQAAASLSHTNIATVFGIDEHEGDMFIAMEYVEGQTLRDKIKEGPLRLKDAVKITKQIAEGLAAAHDKGVVHRDIKSNNIMLTGKNQVKIMDFGLAKMEAGSMVTKAGTTLGTIAYMSPEQARGETVDHRTDIFSLGVILYEMITGQLPFKGEYETAIVYSIINVDPEPLTGVRTGVPMDFEKIINKLLAKDPDDRYQNIIELPVDLKNVDMTSTGTSQISTSAYGELAQPSQSIWKRVELWGAVTVTAIVAVLFVWFFTPKPVQDVLHIPMYMKYSIPRWDKTIAISPDGKFVVFTAFVENSTQLFLRQMDSSLEPKLLSETEGAYYPFFSCDSRWIGFFADGMLKRFFIESETVLEVCNVGTFRRRFPPRGASCDSNDRIVFGNAEFGLSLYSLDTGVLEVITEIKDDDGETEHAWPEFLPDGREILFTIVKRNKEDSRIAILSLETGNYQELPVGEGNNARYSPTGHIIYLTKNVLMAVPFDKNELKGTHPPQPILNDVSVSTNGSGRFAFSNTGLFVYVPEGVEQVSQKLNWIDTNGDYSIIEESGTYGHPRFSPDGESLAIPIAYEDLDNDICTSNVETIEEFKKLTFNAAVVSPVWYPDGKSITFNSRKSEELGIYTISSEGGAVELLLPIKDHELIPTSWSEDGEILAFYEINDSTGRDIYLWHKNDDIIYDFRVTPYSERAARFSPKSNLVAYVSDASGEDNVYIMAFPDTIEMQQISYQGGIQPAWSPDGKKLYYRDLDNWMVSVDIQTEPHFEKGIPNKLFELEDIGTSHLAQYDIHPDGRFVIASDAGEYVIGNMIIIINWPEELKEKFKDENK
ncbi:protein kinase [candidate division KSB1 bacterium]